MKQGKKNQWLARHSKPKEHPRKWAARPVSMQSAARHARGNTDPLRSKGPVPCCQSHCEESVCILEKGGTVGFVKS
jgi:hypothetical protein